MPWRRLCVLLLKGKALQFAMARRLRASSQKAARQPELNCPMAIKSLPTWSFPIQTHQRLLLDILAKLFNLRLNHCRARNARFRRLSGTDMPTLRAFLCSTITCSFHPITLANFARSRMADRPAIPPHTFARWIAALRTHRMVQQVDAAMQVLVLNAFKSSSTRPPMAILTNTPNRRETNAQRP